MKYLKFHMILLRKRPLLNLDLRVLLAPSEEDSLRPIFIIFSHKNKKLIHRTRTPNIGIDAYVLLKGNEKLIPNIPNFAEKNVIITVKRNKIPRFPISFSTTCNRLVLFRCFHFVFPVGFVGNNVFYFAY